MRGSGGGLRSRSRLLRFSVPGSGFKIKELGCRESRVCYRRPRPRIVSLGQGHRPRGAEASRRKAEQKWSSSSVSDTFWD